jgi:hypothetical protein
MPSVCDFNTGGDVAGHAPREFDSLIRGVLAVSMDALAQQDEQQAKTRAEALRAFASMSSTLSPRPRRRSTTKFAGRMPMRSDRFAGLFGPGVQSGYRPVRLPKLDIVAVGKPPGGFDGGLVINTIQLNHANGSVV